MSSSVIDLKMAIDTAAESPDEPKEIRFIRILRSPS